MNHVAGGRRRWIDEGERNHLDGRPRTAHLQIRETEPRAKLPRGFERGAETTGLGILVIGTLRLAIIDRLVGIDSIAIVPACHPRDAHLEGVAERNVDRAGEIEGIVVAHLDTGSRLELRLGAHRDNVDEATGGAASIERSLW